MDDRVISDVQSTWKIVDSMAPEAAALFYKSLFEADPALQHLFRGNMEEQGKSCSPHKSEPPGMKFMV
jgi:hemoglobin-like flavoprotein